jgi:hypothetical protein
VRPADGKRSSERQDIPGTPWTVPHEETGTVVHEWISTLHSCRIYVAPGDAQADLEHQLAHKNGEHETNKPAACPECTRQEGAAA